jgi:uncharacterized membrane protein HdeD (DUF308 family)
LAIVFGLIIVAYPGLSVRVFATFFGLVLLLGGSVISIGAFRSKYLQKDGMTTFILGILSIVLAIVILIYPKESVAAFMLLSLGVWAIISGGILIWAYIRKSGNLNQRPVTIVFGIASLLFGLYMALKPIESTYGVAVLVGICAILHGLLALFYSAHKRYE